VIPLTASGKITAPSAAQVRCAFAGPGAAHANTLRVSALPVGGGAAGGQ
jgi:hypothetical protein